MTHRGNPALKVPALTGAGSEGSMRVTVEGDTVTDVRIEIYEPPRFFEGFLRGRAHTEPPDITARICGICPVAYHTSACNAVEDACGVVPDDATAALRRLLYCGEWIASHALHIYLMHAPDFLGYQGIVEMARSDPAVVERGLALKRAGNTLLEAVGGRAGHPETVRIGGFTAVPDPAELRAVAETALRPALDDALATVAWVSGFAFPDFTHDHELLALVDGHRYPIERGVPHTTGGRSFPVHAFEEHIVEEREPHSSAQYTRLLGGGRYLTGPVARYALNAERLSPLARQAADAAGLPATYRNPYRSIVVRAVEVVHAVEEALALIEAYRPPAPAVEPQPRAATGWGASEAPRGVLFHRYTMAADGTVTDARIVPPTSQNQACIEDDLRRLVQDRLHLDDHQLAAECERAIRNYDPCVSCATHLLALKVVRS